MNAKNSKEGKPTVILGIESSCDESSAAISVDGKILSNIISSQLQHSGFGGVVPELASRLHQQHIVRVVKESMDKSGVAAEAISAIAFTRGPGLMGSLLVGTCFAKAYALGLGVPLIAVNHMRAHVLANFLLDEVPEFPFLCLTVSGGHTQLVLAKDFFNMEIIGQSIDDAAGEAYDKAAKLLGLGYPGGPQIDRLAKAGKPDRFAFPMPKAEGFNFSFSGMKTSLLYFLKEEMRNDPKFIEENISDICASFQNRVVGYLLARFREAAKSTGVKHLAIAGGVSANSELRRRFHEMCEKENWKAHIPPFEFCTDNAGMIAIAGHYQFLANDFTDQKVTPFSRERFLEV